MTTIFKSQLDFFNFNLFVTMRGFIELLTDLSVLLITAWMKNYEF